VSAAGENLNLVAESDGIHPASAPVTEFDSAYHGWRVVLAACLGVMAGFGSLFVYTFSVFVKPLSGQFGWNREAISTGFAIGPSACFSRLAARPSQK